MFAPCPSCRCPFANRVKFTFWGGVLGPKLLTHVKCAQCGATYNGKTGNSNTTGIIIYLAIGAVVSVVLFGLVGLMFFASR